MLEISLADLATTAGMTLAAHPFTYTKTLIQLGHEPLSPVFSQDLFFKRRWHYPGAFEYMGHIRKADGFLGLYRGAIPRILANATSTIAYSYVKDFTAPKMGRKNKTPADPLNKDVLEVIEKLSHETLCRVAAAVVSQPFHVVSIRCMAYFIGREVAYQSPLACVTEIFQKEGILGFFAGLLPRIAYELVSVWFAELLAYGLNTYVVSRKSELRDLRTYTPILTSYIGQSVAYPLSVTTTLMVVNGCAMRGGQPPLSPLYGNWFNCLRDLRMKGEGHRGSNMFFRRAISPPMFVEPLSDITDVAAPVIELIEDNIPVLDKVEEVIEKVVTAVVEEVTEAVE